VFADKKIMKRRILGACFVLLILWMPVQLFAITIQNGEGAVFYYLVRSGSESDLKSLAANPEDIVQYLLANQESLSYIPPNGFEPNVDTGGKAAAVLGFFARPGDSRYPVSAIYVSAANAEAPFTVGASTLVTSRSTGGELTVDSLAVYPSSEPVVIDNRYLDWLRIPDLARFRDSYVPSTYVQVQNASRRELPISDSLFWSTGGSQIDHFKAIRSDRYLYLLMSSTTELSSGLSYIFYLYGDRRTGSGDYTIEIPVDRPSGIVALWKKGSSTPEVVGDFVHSRYLLEARIRLDSLPAVLNDTGVSADLATVIHDSGLTEEFYFGTLFVRNIPK